MQEKSTSALEQELHGCANLQGYLKTNQSALRLSSLSALLQQALVECGLTRAKVARRSGLNNIYVYQLFSGHRHPSRDSLLCLCFGLGLDAARTQTLLHHSGYGQLYVRNPRDCIIYYALDKGMSILEANQQLDELHQSLLG